MPAASLDATDRSATARRLIYVAVAACFGALCYIVYLHLTVLLMAGPMEYREAAMPITTDLLLHGQNPYALNNQPAFTNVYGILYNVVVLPFAKLFGEGFTTHRAVSGVFAIGCCVLLFATLRRRRVSTPLAFIATVLLYAELAARCAKMMPYAMPFSIIARPDAMGLFLFMLTVLIPWRFKFSWCSLIVACFIALAAMLTKPYLAVGLPMVAAFVFLFRSKSKGIAVGVLFAVLAAAAIVGMTWLGPCYYAVVVTGNRASFIYSRSHAIEQTVTYLEWLPGCLAIACVVGVVQVGRLKHLRRRLNILSIHRPLVRLKGDLPLFVLVCGVVLLAGKLAWHMGNSMLYFTQLVTPWLMLVVFPYVTRTVRRGRVWPAAIICLNCVLLPFQLPACPRSYADKWDEWRQILATHNNIYAPPPLAWMLREAGKPVYDNGMSEYFMNSLTGSIYPPEDKLDGQFLHYVRDLDRQLVQRRFGMIIVPYAANNKMFCFLLSNRIDQNYRMVGQLAFPMDWSPTFNALIFVRPDDPVVKKLEGQSHGNPATRPGAAGE